MFIQNNSRLVKSAGCCCCIRFVSKRTGWTLVAVDRLSSSGAANIKRPPCLQTAQLPEINERQSCCLKNSPRPHVCGAERLRAALCDVRPRAVCRPHTGRTCTLTRTIIGPCAFVVFRVFFGLKIPFGLTQTSILCFCLAYLRRRQLEAAPHKSTETRQPDTFAEKRNWEQTEEKKVCS